MSRPMRLLAVTTLASLAVAACDTGTEPDVTSSPGATAEVAAAKFWRRRRGICRRSRRNTNS